MFSRFLVQGSKAWKPCGCAGVISREGSSTAGPSGVNGLPVVVVPGVPEGGRPAKSAASEPVQAKKVAKPVFTTLDHHFKFPSLATGPYALSQGKPIQWQFGERIGSEQAMRYDFVLGELHMPIVVPNGEREMPSGCDLPTVWDVAQALARLPSKLLRHIGQIVISPYRLSANAAAKAETKNQQITFVPSDVAGSLDPLTNVLFHEATHAWQQSTGWAPQPSPWWGAIGEARSKRAWQAAIDSDGAEGVTPYAAMGAHEDQAEFVVCYFAKLGTTEEEEFRARYPARCAILDGEFGASPVGGGLANT